MSEKENKGNEENVKPVKLGRGATCAVIVGLCLVVLILIVTVRGCSVEKTVNSAQTEEPVKTEATEPIQAASNMPSSEVNFSENDPENGSSVSSPVENSTTANTMVSTEEHFTTPTTEESSNSSDSWINEVADPVLSEQRSAMGMVIGKHTYVANDSYVYGVTISLIVNEDSVMVNYFCPRKTYESLKSGDSLSVVYQVDSNGRISVSSISFG